MVTVASNRVLLRLSVPDRSRLLPAMWRETDLGERTACPDTEPVPLTDWRVCGARDKGTAMRDTVILICVILIAVGGTSGAVLHDYQARQLKVLEARIDALDELAAQARVLEGRLDLAAGQVITCEAMLREADKLIHRFMTGEP